MKGGKREGSGRKATPATTKIAIGLKLPPRLIKWMTTRPESRAVLIETALVAHFKIKMEKPRNPLMEKAATGPTP